MDSEDVWNDTSWLTNARMLLAWLRAQSPREVVLLILRHSHRAQIDSHDVTLAAGLTDIGRITSYEMGRRLPTDRPVRFFTSFVPRCFETAEMMAQGLRDAGGEFIDIDPLPVLVMPEYTDRMVWAELQPDGLNVHEFVNRWADGEFTGRVQDLQEYGAHLFAETVERAINAGPSELHIHVTHDLAIMVMKRLVLGRALQRDDRENYLGGLGIRAYADGRYDVISGRDLIARSQG